MSSSMSLLIISSLVILPPTLHNRNRKPARLSSL
jgi:hypothetical protein